MNEYLARLAALPQLDTIKYTHSLVSLFSGGGGLDLGLALAGFETKYAGDIEQPHCDTISWNFPGCVTEARDVRELSGAGILRAAGLAEVDLLAGGPPCQAFSILGQRQSINDPRGQLVYEYARLVTELQPRAFMFENVPGLLTVHGGQDWRDLLAYFERATGYHLHTQVLNAADFGIPQIRKRVILIGLREEDAQFEFPAPTHIAPDAKSSLGAGYLSPWLPSRYAFEDLDGTPNHRIRVHGERVHNRYSQIAPGERDRVDHTDRIHPDRPSGTVLVGSKAGGGRPFIHPFVPRHISVREAARLQSFTDWYEFRGTDTWQYRAVGNAVPPLLAMAIGEQIVESLSRSKESDASLAAVSGI